MEPKQYQLVMIVEAMQVRPDNSKMIALWCGGITKEEIDNEDRTVKFAAVNVPTLIGPMRASEGDYVIKKANGAFEVIKQHIFERDYRLVE